MKVEWAAEEIEKNVDDLIQISVFVRIGDFGKIGCVFRRDDIVLWLSRWKWSTRLSRWTVDTCCETHLLLVFQLPIIL